MCLENEFRDMKVTFLMSDINDTLRYHKDFYECDEIYEGGQCDLQTENNDG